MNFPISININFDSLNEAYGFKKNKIDPTFFQVFDRIDKLASKYDFPLSIFVIGKDLENPEHARQVKIWHDKGYEIGNHSWSHFFNFGSLNDHQIYDEVYKSHELIYKITGSEPKGFIAPAWNTSRTLLETLAKLNYLYDTSAFPSFILYPMLLKILFNHKNNLKKGLSIINRKDWLHPFYKPNSPYLYKTKSKELLILPLPAIKRYYSCIWHTMGFVFGEKFLKKNIKNLIKEYEGFYYLLHPSDFLDAYDTDKSMKHSLERVNVPLDYKMKLIEEVFEILADSKRKVVTMKNLAELHLKEIISKH